MRRLGIVYLLVAQTACGGAPSVGGTAGSDEIADGGEPTDEEASSERQAPPPRPLTDDEAARTQAQAMSTHTRARELQQRCDEGNDEEACTSARNLFRIAADTWAALVGGRPDDEGVADWSFMHAQALFHAESYWQAGEAAERYLAAGGSPQWRVQAARLLVTARERALQAGRVQVQLREAPPPVRGQPPTVEELTLPEAVRGLFGARERFLESVTPEEDEDRTRRQYGLDNALLLYRYGHWERARTLLQGILEAGCTGEGAWNGAKTAWATLRQMAVALERWDAVLALGQQLRDRSCTFGEDAAPTCGADSDHPSCIARADAVSGRLRGGTRLMQRAEQSRGAERRRWAGRAGDAFLQALEMAELPPAGRVAALTQAAAAFRAAGDRARAAEVDRRIIDEVDPGRLEALDRPMAVEAVASALSRSAEAAVAAGHHEDVVRFAQRLTSPDFDLPELSDERARALRMLPASMVALGRHRDAAAAFSAVAAGTDDVASRREATLSAALELVAASDCRRALPALRSFVDAHRADEGARDSVVRALWQGGQCQRSRAGVSQAVLDDIAALVADGRGTLGPEARGHAGEAAFQMADRDFDAVVRVRIELPRGENVEELAEALRERLREPAERVAQLLQRYDGVERFDDARSIVAARDRGGLALEALASAVLAARWQIPNDLQQQRRAITAASFEQLRRIVESRVGEILEAQATPIRCRAASRFHRAARAASRGVIDSEHSREASARLEAIGNGIVSRCRAANPQLFR